MTEIYWEFTQLLISQMSVVDGAINIAARVPCRPAIMLRSILTCFTLLLQRRSQTSHQRGIRIAHAHIGILISQPIFGRLHI